MKNIFSSRLPALVVLFFAPWILRAEGTVSASHVWPQPPDQPRLAFVRSISCPADIGAKVSAWSHVAAFLTGVQKNAVRLEKPFGLSVDDNGNLCVTDTGAGSVCYFDFRRKKFHQWKQAGPIAFKSPVAAVKWQDTFYVADSQLGAVLAFRDEGRLLFAISNQLARPAGLTVLAGKLYVVDSRLHQVAVFDRQGRFLFHFGKRGLGPGEFNFPSHIAAGSRGQILITDSMNCRIEIFDSEGHFQGAIGDAGDSSGHFSRPKGVAMDQSGNVYVMDALFDNLQIFSQQGQFLLEVGSTGNGPGQFWLPGGIAIDRDNQIYIADSYNQRVQVFKYIGP